MKTQFRCGCLGRLDPSKSHVTIVGAGVSGLLAAYTLKKKGYSVEVLEANARVGGLIDTVQTPWGMAEKAAHSFVMSPALKELFQQLNVPVVEVNQNKKARYILRRGRLRRFPLSLFETMGLIWRFFTKSVVLTATIDDWGRRCWGTGPTQYLLSPLVAGIYAGSLKTMSWTAAFPSLALAQGKTMAQRLLFLLRNRTAEKKPMVALQEGTGALIKALAEGLKNEIRLENTARDLGALLEKGNVIVTAPAYAAAPLLESLQPPQQQTNAAMDSLSKSLSAVEYVSLVTSTVFVRRSAVPGFKEGVGVLIPEAEGLRVRGILFNSSAFQGRIAPDFVNENILSLTIMMGGAADPAVLDLSDVDLKQLMEVELRQLLGLSEPLLHIETTRWQRALPHYTASLEGLWTQAQQALAQYPGLVLFGNYTGQVSVRGLVDSLAYFSDVSLPL